MALNQEDIENFTTTVEDAVSYPILTRDASDYPHSRNGSSRSGSSNGITALSRTAQQTIRDVTGWRYRNDDPKGFIAALNKAFSLKEVDGHIEWEWKAQSYMVQADLGQVTGAQASVYKQASVALENSLPLLDGLTPLRSDADKEDTEAMRAIIRTELKELVDELGLTGGPRVQRVDSFFEKLIGPLNPAPSFDPEQVAGQLASLQLRFGLTRARVNTITEEQNLTNFLILVDYVNALYQSWDSKRGYFDGTAEPFLGTQLVLLSEVLDAILEQLQETYDAMDSVFFGPAERQTTEIALTDGSLSVAEILSWVESFASSEGRQLIQDGGKDGVVVFNSTMVRVQEIVQEAADIAAQPSSNPVRPFHTRRVALSLGELASYLSTAVDRAGEISRTPTYVAEQVGKEENVIWPRSGSTVERTLSANVLAVDWTEHFHDGKWLARQPADVIYPGDKIKVVLLGRQLRDLSLDFGEGFHAKKIQYDPSGRKAEAIVKVASDAEAGSRDLLVKDANKKKQSISNALTIENRVQQQQLVDLEVSDLCPACGHQGESLTVTVKGSGLRGAAISFGSGIMMNGTTYRDDETMEATIAIDRRAQEGERTVNLYRFDCQTATAPKKFKVAPARPSPFLEVAVRETPSYKDPCEEETDEQTKGSDKTSATPRSEGDVAKPVKSAVTESGLKKVKNKK
jgi:hypothetical protein